MSTRANRVVFLDDLLDEAAELALEEVRKRRPELPDAEAKAIAEAVGIAAVRFNIARIQPEKPIEFRWEEALSFEGDSAPYLLYAHARACSLLGEARKAGLDAAHVPDAAFKGAQAGEVAFLRTVARYPQAVAEAAAQYAPHRMCSYALELAAAFNEYYRDHRVLECEDKAEQQVRLRTMDVGRQAMRTVLETLGLPVLETM